MGHLNFLQYNDIPVGIQQLLPPLVYLCLSLTINSQRNSGFSYEWWGEWGVDL